MGSPHCIHSHSCQEVLPLTVKVALGNRTHISNLSNYTDAARTNPRTLGAIYLILNGNITETQKICFSQGILFSLEIPHSSP